MGANFESIQVLVESRERKISSMGNSYGELLEIHEARRCTMKTELNFVKSSSSLPIKNGRKTMTNFTLARLSTMWETIARLRATRKIFSSRSSYDHVKTSALIPFNSSSRYPRLAEIKSADSLNTFSPLFSSSLSCVSAFRVDMRNGDGGSMHELLNSSWTW